MGRTIYAVVMSLFLVTATFTPVASAAGAGGSTFEAYDDSAFVGHDGSALTETAERQRSSENGPYHGKRSGGKPGKAGTGGKEKGGEKKGGKAGGKQSGKGKEKGKSGEAGNGKQSGNGQGKDKGAKNGKGQKKDNPGKAKGHGKSGKGKGHGKSGKAKGHGKERGGGPPAACGKSTPASERASPKAGGTPPGLAKKCGAEQTNQTNESLTPPGVDGSLSALELRVTAWRLLADAPNSDEDDRSLSAAEAEELREVLNRSFVHFVGFDRVRSRTVFEDDKEVAAAAGKRAPNVTAHLIVADETLARTALGDAERVYAGLDDGEVDDAAVERELTKARRAVAQAEHVRTKSPNPVAAVTHYRRAWTHAQRALDLMDAATSPRVEIVDRADPVHDGPINYTVRGTVTDVRPWLVGNVTVSVNGEETTTPVFAGNATPGQVWGFAATVRLEEPVNRIEVSANDSGSVVAEGSEPFEPNEGTDVLLLDGDRLPDVYEANRTTTDPLDPDSDANATDADEGADNVTDGEADLDGDRLSNVDELELGTDPLAADTDGDGLTDAFEVLITDTDPLVADTDGDGTPDGEEDPDGDGLTNAEEERGGSDPSRVDGDFDGLSDPEELRIGTDPLVPDTDDDGLLDGRELEAPFHTEPLDPDTDDDGVLDGDETYTTTEENESLGATVDVTGPGDASAALSVEEDGHVFLNNSGTRKAGVSSRIRIDSARDFEKARVTLDYDEDVLGDESDVSVYRYDPTHQTFIQFASTVDEENDTVSTTTSRNGTYVAFNDSAWESLFEEPLPSEYDVEVTEFGDQGVTCEGSGECDVDGGAISLGNAEPPSQTQSFGGGFGIKCAGCPSEPVIIRTPTPTPGGGTGGISDPIDLDECPDDPETEDKPCFVVTATGLSFLLPEGAQVIDLEFEAWADVPNDESYAEVRLETPAGTETIFSRNTEGTTGLHTVDVDLSTHDGETVSIEVEKGGNASIWVDDIRLWVDSDNDGLSDNEEREGFRVGWGETVTTDVNDPDTDGDDLTDHDEVRYRYNHFGRTYFIVNSDPTKEDSDDDNIEDKPETESDGVKLDVFSQSVTVDGKTYTGPYRWDPDNNNDEVTVETHPLNPDSDGDGLGDGKEQYEYHSRADQKVSYSITEIHQDQIVDEFHRQWLSSDVLGKRDVTVSARHLRLIGPSDSAGKLATVQLTDATDDFDFVTADDHDHELVFRALDRNERTDTWFSNVEEEHADTKIWDPDSDDDGLTDGQEVYWVTSADRSNPFEEIRVEDVNQQGVFDFEKRLGTDPNDPDHDDDGYWDGWIGVYDVGRTDNVVLYMEHLQTGNGIQSGEMVDEQIETHRWGGENHSKVHLGELHWGTNPDGGDTPSPSLTIEVDYYNTSATKSLWRRDSQGNVVSKWATRIENNYALYGVHVQMDTDQVVEPSELPPNEMLPLLSASGSNTNETFSLLELARINRRHHDSSGTQYMFVANRSHFPAALGGQQQSGINMYFTGGGINTRLPINIDPQGIAVFAGRYQDDLRNRKTAVHEIGHSLQIGEADDDCTARPFRGGEIYSGETGRVKDTTPEIHSSRRFWSVMSAGWSNQLASSPMNGDYFAFSIEELSTATTETRLPCQ